MQDNTNLDTTSDERLLGSESTWFPIIYTNRKAGLPNFPPDQDIDRWLKHNAPLSFESLADIRYALYHHCSRAEFIISLLADDEFKLTGRHCTLKVVNDDARHYLLWRLRLLGRKNEWIRALPITKNHRK